MADYPSGVYSPRTKNNKEGVEYDPEEDTKIFAEDVENLDNEVVAIENELGANPKAGYANVTARLAALLAAIQSNASDLSTHEALFANQHGRIIKIDSGSAVRYTTSWQTLSDLTTELGGGHKWRILIYMIVSSNTGPDFKYMIEGNEEWSGSFKEHDDAFNDVQKSLNTSYPKTVTGSEWRVLKIEGLIIDQDFTDDLVIKWAPNSSSSSWCSVPYCILKIDKIE